MQESSVGRNAVEVLAEEFVDRYRQGERPPLSEYIARFPDLAEEIRDLFPAMLMMENLKPVDESTATELPQVVLGQLGDYRIIREVGRGGMGVVYEAEQVSLGRHVALKVLPREMVANPNQRLRFEREARAAAKLHHTNIVPVFGVGDTDGRLYYVMQFIQGSALDDVLEELKRLRGTANGGGLGRSGVRGREIFVAESLLSGVRTRTAGDVNSEGLGSKGAGDGKQLVAAVVESNSVEPGSGAAGRSDKSGLSNSSLTLPKRTSDSSVEASRRTTYCESIAQIGVQVARALDYAHSQGILHRDIKPANLVLDLKGTVWVTDFGLAKLDDDQGLTQVGDILGTLRYMSPESFKGQSDKRSEVYSLGLTLYEMLAFRPAFNENSRNALIDKVMTAQVDRLVKVNPEVPPDLRTIIHKAIDRDPDLRYQTAGDLADDLQRFLNDEPINARRVAPLERLNRWSRRNRSLAASLAAVMLLVSLLAIGSTISAGYFRSVSNDLKSAVSDLERTQKNLSAKLTELDLATKAATQSKIEAVQRSNEAEAAGSAAQTMLADMQTERELTALTDGDPATAMLWFANAADQTRHDPERQAANRLRAKNAMEESLLPVAMLLHRVPGERLRLSFQSQGTLLLSFQRDSLQVWDWQSEESLAWADELAGMSDANWSPDGSYLAVAFRTGELQIRASRSGQVVRQFKHSEPIEALAWSPDSHRLAVAGRDVGVWSVQGEPALQYVCRHADTVHSLVFDRDGSRLATACRDRLVRVFVLAGTTVELAHAFPPVPHEPVIESPPIFVDSGRRLITIPDHGQIGWWDAATGIAAAPPAANLTVNIARKLVASQDGQRFAVAADPAVVWNVDGGTRQALPHSNHVLCIAFIPEGNSLVTGCLDWMARVWDLAAPSGRPMVVPQMESVLQCATSADGSHLAVCGAETIRIWKQPELSRAVVGHAGWKLRNQKPRPSFDERWVTPGRWHETPHYLNLPNSIVVAEIASGRPAGPEIFINQIVDTCICADNQAVAVASLAESAGKVSIIDVASGKESFPPIMLDGIPCSVAARSDPSQVAVLCRHGQIAVVNPSDGSRVFDISIDAWGQEFFSAKIRYTPDGRRLVHLTADNQIAVYDATTGEPCYANIRPLQSPGICRTFEVSADSQWLATGVNGQNRVQVWDLVTGKAASEPLPHPGDIYGIFAVAFSPDGRWLISGNKDGRARVWDWRTAKLVCPPLQHADEVFSVGFSKDGRYAVTGVRYGTLRLWDLGTGKPISAAVRYPLFDSGSTECLTVVGNRAIVCGLDYPIIDLEQLTAAPELPTRSIQLLAQLATGRRLELGELSGLSAAEWSALWSKSPGREFTPARLAASFAKELDQATDTFSRLLIAERAAKSDVVLTELAQLRRDVPELQLMLARAAEGRKDGSSKEAIQRAIAQYEKRLSNLPEDVALAEQLTELLLATHRSPWRQLEFRRVTSRDGAVFARRDDGALVVSGKHATADVYTLETTGTGEEVAAIRLDALTDPSLPNGGPGRHGTGNYQLAAFRLFRTGNSAGEARQPVPLSDAYASHSFDWPDVNIRDMIRGIRRSIWHVFAATGRPHFAVFALDHPVTVDDQHPLTIEIQHNEIEQPINLGCFRVSASKSANMLEYEIELRNIRSRVYAGPLALAATYMLFDQHAKAIPWLERTTRSRDVTTAGVRLMLVAECCHRLQQADPARTAYERWLHWLETNGLPDVFHPRALRLMQTIEGISSEHAGTKFARLNIQREIRSRSEAIQPKNAIHYYHRAVLYARLGQWREAAADHLKMVELMPDDRLVWLRGAVLLMMANDLPGHQALCERMLAKFAGTEDSLRADTICKSYFLDPDAKPIADLPTAVITRALDNGEEQTIWYTAVCALVALREGNHQRAIELSLRPGQSPPGPSGGMILAVRGLAQHHLGQSEAALQSLTQANATVPAALRNLRESPECAPAQEYEATHDWLIAELLRREADRAIRPLAKGP